MYINEEFPYALLVFAYNGVEMVAGLYGYKGSLTTSTLGFNVFSLTWVPVVDSSHVHQPFRALNLFQL